MDFIRFFLVLIVPGIIAALVYAWITHCKCAYNILNALIFDLLIFIINIIGLFIFKDINTILKLIASFICLSFTAKYALLSILIALILGTLFGFIRKCVFWWRKCD